MAAETVPPAAELTPEATKPVAGQETAPAPHPEPTKPDAAAAAAVTAADAPGGVDAEPPTAVAPAGGEEVPAEADKEVVAVASLDKEIVPPFKQETYVVSELKDFEKKALEEFKLRIEAAIKANEFVVPPPPPPPAPKEEEIKPEEDKEKEVKAEGEGEVEVPAKTEEKAVEAAPAKEEPALVEVVKAAVAEAATDVKEKAAAVEAKVEELAPAPTPAPAPAPAPAAEEAAASAEPVDKEAPVADDKDKPVEAAPVEEPVIVIDEDISLWGVPLLHTKGDERTNVILLKFLRARDFKVKDAFVMLKKTIIWRKTFNADGLLDEDFGTELDTFAFMSGVDKDHHPVCYNVLNPFKDKKLHQNAFGSPEKIESFIRWRIQVLEKGIKHLNFTPEGPHSMVQITDLRNSVLELFPFGLRPQVKKVLNLLQDNYPELVVRKIFINVPWYFSAPYTLFISPFLTQRTKSKLVVATAGKVTETLFKYISPDQVPVQYGGFKSASESHFDGLEVPITELTIKAGAVETIEIPSPHQKATIYWDVVVVGWDVTYLAEYTPVEGYTTIVEKSKKISATEGQGPLSPSFPAHAPGKVVITIDNSASKKKKLVVYRYDVVTTSCETTELAG